MLVNILVSDSLYMYIWYILLLIVISHFTTITIHKGECHDSQLSEVVILIVVHDGNVYDSEGLVDSG